MYIRCDFARFLPKGHDYQKKKKRKKQFLKKIKNKKYSASWQKGVISTGRGKEGLNKSFSKSGLVTFFGRLNGLAQTDFQQTSHSDTDTTDTQKHTRTTATHTHTDTYTMLHAHAHTIDKPEAIT